MLTSSYAYFQFGLAEKAGTARGADVWSCLVQASKFMTKWSHMRSKFMCEFNNCCWCDLYVTVRQTMPVWVNPTKYSCLVALMFSPLHARIPLSTTYQTTKAPRRADIYQKSTCTELGSIIHSLPTLEIPPDIWMQAWLRSLQVNLALRWDPIMIQCTLSSCETAGAKLRILRTRLCGSHVFYLNYFTHNKKTMFFWIFITQFIVKSKKFFFKSLLIILFPDFVATLVVAISWKFRVCGPTY
jgi:hypothetical protein